MQIELSVRLNRSQKCITSLPVSLCLSTCLVKENLLVHRAIALSSGAYDPSQKKLVLSISFCHIIIAMNTVVMLKSDVI